MVSRICVALVVVLGIVALFIYFVPIDYAYIPSETDALNPVASQPTRYDYWGKLLSQQEASSITGPAAGALVRIDGALLRQGREAFYGETFGDEIFLTEVLGIIDGPVNLYSFAKALFKLKGAGTTNLRVELTRDANVRGQQLPKGTLIDTGLDVAKGAYFPLGMRIRKRGGQVLVGITCAACHSTVDPQSKRVIHGAPNIDLNAGLPLALASNSAAYFLHTDVSNLNRYVTPASLRITGSDGKTLSLPDPGLLEQAVDDALSQWPPGSFDSMIDLRADPTQIPSSFTREGYPYGWSGFAGAGPFRGLSSLNNNVHGLNSDALTDTELAPRMFGIDPELYIAINLQNAAHERFRFNVRSGRKPSEFLRSVDPTPGVMERNQLVPLPHFPSGSLVSPDGLLVGKPGSRVWEEINAIAAWQNSLAPPPPLKQIDASKIKSGRTVFERARCNSCHDGPALTNHRIVPAKEIGSEPVRAAALSRTEGSFVAPVLYSFEEKVPLREHATLLQVPTLQLEQVQIDLAFAWKKTGGGYKVPNLVGLNWTAPYLHDGGVAVGDDASTESGVPETLLKGISPNPENSLRALIDRKLRAHVVRVNTADPRLRRVNSRGIGHEFWVDTSAGYSLQEQDDLIDYLLSFSFERMG